MAGRPVLQPAAQGGGGAQVGVVGAPDRDRRAGAVLVGLRAPDRQHDAAAVDELEVADVEPDDLGAPPKPASRMARLRRPSGVSGWARTMRASIAGVIGVAWRAVRERTAVLDRQLLAAARASATCRRLMTAPGVGAIVAAAFVAAVEKPENFRNSRAVGVWIGLTPRRYQSGEVDYDGHISRRGDARLRALLYEAAVSILTRVQSESTLRRWALALKTQVGFKRAAVALARKLAVILHAMWKTGTDFDPRAAVPAAA